jgi:hypothetical protein
MSTLVLEDVGASTPGNPLRLRFDSTGDTDVDFEVDDDGNLEITPEDGRMTLREDPSAGSAGFQMRVIATGTAFIGQHVIIEPTAAGQPIGPMNTGGWLGAGVHSNSALFGRLDVGASSPVSGFIQNDRTAGTLVVQRLEFTGQTPNDEVSKFLECEDTTNVKMHVWSNGDVENVNNNYGAISDESLKQDIIDADPQSQWDDIKAMRFRKYRLKADVADRGENARTCLGCVGQEMQAVSPGLVKTDTTRKVVTEHLLEDGGRSYEVETFNDGPPILSIAYSVLYMKGMVALQEAMRRIEALEAQA